LHQDSAKILKLTNNIDKLKLKLNQTREKKYAAEAKIAEGNFVVLTDARVLISEVFQAMLVGLYMGVLRICLSGLACSYPPGLQPYLTIKPDIICFGGQHVVMAAVAVVTLHVLYPMASASYPLFQVVTSATAKFQFSFLFMVTQVQTWLVVLSTFFGSKEWFVLFCCLLVDLLMVVRTVHKPKWISDQLPVFLREPPCRIVVVNQLTATAFLFSAWLNVCSMLTVYVGGDLSAVILLFTVCFFVVWYWVSRLSSAMFPRKNLDTMEAAWLHMASHNKANKEESPLIEVAKKYLGSIAMLEFVAKTIDISTSLAFILGTVLKDDGTVWSNWSLLSKFLVVAFAYDCIFTIGFLVHLFKLRFCTRVNAGAARIAIVRLNKSASGMVMFDLIQVFATLGYSARDMNAVVSSLGSLLGAYVAVGKRSAALKAFVGDLESGLRDAEGGGGVHNSGGIDREHGFIVENPLANSVSSDGQKRGAGTDEKVPANATTLADILSENGLGKWHAKFEAEDLTLSNISDLTNDDLKELGLPMGARKDILKLFCAKPSASEPDQQTEVV
jgi:hypothetical protein